MKINNYNDLFIACAWDAPILRDLLKEVAPNKEQFKNSLLHALYPESRGLNPEKLTDWDYKNHKGLESQLKAHIIYAVIKCIDWDYVAAEMMGTYCKWKIEELEKGLRHENK